MGHDPTKVVLGGKQSSVAEIGNRKGTVLAGTAVRQKSDGTMSTISTDGRLIGISMGRDLSDAGFTSIAYRGEAIPVLLGAAFTPTIGTDTELSEGNGPSLFSLFVKMDRGWCLTDYPVEHLVDLRIPTGLASG